MKKEEIAKLFQMFAGTDLIRPDFNQPFKQNGRYIATDAHSLIYAPVEILDRENLSFDAQDKPDCSKVLAEVSAASTSPSATNILIDLADLESKLIPDMEDEVRQSGEKCDECNGEGEVEYEYRSKKGRTYELSEDCPICSGSGEKFKDVPTGKKIPIMSTLFKMDGIGFQYRQLKRLIDASRLIGVQQITQLCQNAKGPNLFRVGDFSIVVMPALLDEPGYMEEPTYKEIKLSQQ